MSTFRNSFGAALSIPDVWPRPSFDRGPEWVTGGKSLSEYIFSELPQIADVVRSRFTIRRTHSYCGLRVLGPSNSMLSGGPTTPQDYPEKSGFARRRERECGHRRHWGRHNQETHPCASTSSAVTESPCAASRRLQ